MSYILDALKKSEQERSRGAIPDIRAIHQPRAEHPKEPVYWPYVLLAIVLINAGGIGYWIYQQDKPSVHSNAANAEMPAEGKGDAVAAVEFPLVVGEPAVVDAAPDVLPQSANDLQEQLTRNLAALESGSEAELTEVQSRTQAPELEPMTAAKPNVIFSEEPLSGSSGQTAGKEADQEQVEPGEVIIRPRRGGSDRASNAAAARSETIYEIAELPSDIKRGLPQISFAGHVYSSTKSQRSVMLNGKKMREGQELAKGLLLEEITMDGVILSSQGYRFKLGALQDWAF